MTTYSDVRERDITIVIPTLNLREGQKTGNLAKVTSGCSVEVYVNVVHDKHRQGFSRVVNKGIRLAPESHDIVILNDDVTAFQYGWLEILRRVLYLKPKYGMTCPSGLSACAPQNKGRPGSVGLQAVRQASFWCVLLKRDMIKELGILDEAFIHYCSDNWYCHRMRVTGWKCIWVKSVYLQHTKHASGIQQEWKRHDRAIYFARLDKQ